MQIITNKLFLFLLHLFFIVNKPSVVDNMLCTVQEEAGVSREVTGDRT